MSATINKSSKVKKASDIYALSEYLGLSVGTISNVFNRPQIVAEKTRNKVLDGADKLGYRPDYFARGLSGGKTMTIGLITGLGNQTAIDQTRSIIRAAEKHNYLTHTIEVYKRGDDNQYLIQRAGDLLDRKVDGLIISRPRPLTDSAIEFFNNCSTPVVLVSPWSSSDVLNSIVLDMVSAIDQLAQHLYELGHKRVAYFPSQQSYDYLDHRIRPYQRAFLSRGIDFVTGHNLEVGKYAADLSDESYRAVQSYLQQDTATTALLMNNDIGATGALAAVRDMGLKVPDDISIAGFDNLHGVQYYTPALTTIAPPDSNQIGGAVFNMLHTLIKDPGAEVEKQIFSFKLIPRDSTGKVRCRHQGSSRTGVSPVIPAQQETITGQISKTHATTQTSQIPGRGFHCQTNSVIPAKAGIQPPIKRIKL